MTRGWAFHHDWRRRVRRWLLGSVRTATRRLVPSLPVLVFIAAVAWGLAQVARIKPIP